MIGRWISGKGLMRVGDALENGAEKCWFERMKMEIEMAI